MNQLLPPGTVDCCAIAKAFVVGKLRPQNTLATMSICTALTRCASRDTREPYRGSGAGGKQNESECLTRSANGKQFVTAKTIRLLRRLRHTRHGAVNSRAPRRRSGEGAREKGEPTNAALPGPSSLMY